MQGFVIIAFTFQLSNSFFLSLLIINVL